MALVNRPQIVVRPPAKSTDRNPTMGALLGNSDQRDWVKVRVPKITHATKITFEPIRLNKQEFKPGEVYRLPPLIAEELQKSIDNFEESIIRQMNGAPSLNPVLMRELAEQKAFAEETRNAQVTEGPMPGMSTTF